MAIAKHTTLASNQNGDGLELEDHVVGNPTESSSETITISPGLGTWAISSGVISGNPVDRPSDEGTTTSLVGEPSDDASDDAVSGTPLYQPSEDSATSSLVGEPSDDTSDDAVSGTPLYQPSDDRGTTSLVGEPSDDISDDAVSGTPAVPTVRR